MGKKAQLEIKESVSELEKELRKQGSLSREKRIRCLLFIKTGKFKTRQALAVYLGIHIRTMERWINKYKMAGISQMLYDEPKQRQSKIITEQIHNGLEERVNDAHNPFLGYWDAQIWVQQTYGVNIKYQRIREYLIKHFKTKIKTPRKSHVKKDMQAENAFLKTADSIQRP